MSEILKRVLSQMNGEILERLMSLDVAELEALFDLLRNTKQIAE